MATSGNCSNCGSTLAPGAIACARCGRKLSEPAPAEAPASGPTFTTPPEPGQSLDISAVVAATRKRWRVEHSSLFLAAFVMAALAFLISTIAGPSLVAAGDDAFERRIDNSVWLQLAFGLALGAAALSILIRWQSGPPKRSDESMIDFRAGMLFAVMTLIFTLLGLFKGFDGSFDGVDAWFRFANVYAVLAVAIFAISRPIPGALGTMSTTTIGIAAVGVSAAALVIGQFMGLSNDNDTFVTGLGFQGAGIAGMTLALGWFLGLQSQRGD